MVCTLQVNKCYHTNSQTENKVTEKETNVSVTSRSTPLYSFLGSRQNL